MASDDRVRPAVMGFDTNAADYERARPSYPAEAVALIVGRGGIGPGRQVLDLAAGTGKLTRLLVPTGADVIAVEPMAGMREQLTRLSPQLDVRDGVAEQIPLADGSVDVVTVAQAFHWFDPDAALAEIRRVLRPGGGLFLVWNTRDRSVEWVCRYTDLLGSGPGGEKPFNDYHEVDYAAVVAAAGGFTPVELWSQRWEQVCDEQLLVARAASVSIVGALPEIRRNAVLESVRDLARTHPDLVGRASFPFPYTVHVWWCWKC